MTKKDLEEKIQLILKVKSRLYAENRKLPSDAGQKETQEEYLKIISELNNFCNQNTNKDLSELQNMVEEWRTQFPPASDAHLKIMREGKPVDRLI